MQKQKKERTTNDVCIFLPRVKQFRALLQNAKHTVSPGRGVRGALVTHKAPTANRKQQKSVASNCKTLDTLIIASQRNSTPPDRHSCVCRSRRITEFSYMISDAIIVNPGQPTAPHAEALDSTTPLPLLLHLFLLSPPAIRTPWLWFRAKPKAPISSTGSHLELWVVAANCKRNSNFAISAIHVILFDLDKCPPLAVGPCPPLPMTLLSLPYRWREIYIFLGSCTIISRPSDPKVGLEIA